MFDFTFFALAALIFLALIGAYHIVSASWERVGHRGTGRIVGRLDDLKARNRLGED